MATNFIRNIVDKKITDNVHNVFTRYSLGEFVKEPFVVKVGKKEWTIYTGFEYLNFLHFFLAERLNGNVTVDGVIESVRDLSGGLEKLGIQFSSDKRFGKQGAKYVFTAELTADTYKKMVTEFFSEYLLFNVVFTGGQLKVKKKSTPKLGSATNKFVTIKLPFDLTEDFRKDYLFDVDGKFALVEVDQTYMIDEIKVDDKLLAKDPLLARKNAMRVGTIVRTVTVDGKGKVTKIPFKV